MRKLFYNKENVVRKRRKDEAMDYVMQLMNQFDESDQKDENIKEFVEIATLERKKEEEPDLPDYLIAKISFELLHEPVLTADGITYESNDLRQHFDKIGYFDPITRYKHSITITISIGVSWITTVSCPIKQWLNV